MENIEERIQKIEERNTRVEADKKWETSWARRIILMILTYLLIGITLAVIGIAQPWMNAIIPAVAFVISTLTLSFFKKRWVRNNL